MRRYYTKVLPTIPSAKEVYLSPRGLANVAMIDDKIRDWTIENLKTKLADSCTITDLNKFRVFVFCTSKALSNYGIAPQWQKLENACITEDQRAALIEDAPVIDLYWLARTFPKHKTINQRWQLLFNNGFDLELALSIGERQKTTAAKVRHDLKLSRLQQIGCIHFIRKSKYPTEGKLSALSQLESAKNRSKTHYKRELQRGNAVYQVTPKIALYRALILECYILADKSPTNAAKVYKWKTGKEIDRANVARTIKRINEAVARKV